MTATGKKARKRLGNRYACKRASGPRTRPGKVFGDGTNQRIIAALKARKVVATGA